MADTPDNARPVMLKAEAEDAAALLEEDDRYSLGHADHVASAYKYRILALKIEEVANV